MVNTGSRRGQLASTMEPYRNTTLWAPVWATPPACRMFQLPDRKGDHLVPLDCANTDAWSPGVGYFRQSFRHHSIGPENR